MKDTLAQLGWLAAGMLIIVGVVQVVHAH